MMWGILYIKDRSSQILHTSWGNTWILQNIHTMKPNHIKVNEKEGQPSVPCQWASQGTQSSVFPAKFYSFVPADAVSYNLQWQIFWIFCNKDFSPQWWLSFIVQLKERWLKWVLVGLLHTASLPTAHFKQWVQPGFQSIFFHRLWDSSFKVPFKKTKSGATWICFRLAQVNVEWKNCCHYGSLEHFFVCGWKLTNSSPQILAELFHEVSQSYFQVLGYSRPQKS